MSILGLPPPSPGDPAWWTAVFAGVAAFGTLFASIAAISALIYYRSQSRSASTAIGIDCLFKLLEYWDGPTMRRRRTRAGAALALPEPTFSQCVFDIANHFELVGFLVFEARVVSETDAWGSFSSWAAPYWKAMEPLLAVQTKDDPTLWERYKELVNTFDRLERERAGLKETAQLPYVEELAVFLESERCLMEDDAEPTPTASGASSRSLWFRFRNAFS